MTDADRESAIIVAGQLIGMASRFTPEDFDAAAESCGLIPQYAEMIRACARFRREIMPAKREKVT